MKDLLFDIINFNALKKRVEELERINWELSVKLMAYRSEEIQEYNRLHTTQGDPNLKITFRKEKHQ